VIHLSKRTLLLLIGLSALVGMALVFYATTYGLGVGGDATIYLISAKNFILGKGLGWTEADGSFRLLPYTPPFYPLVLSFIGLFGDMGSGARMFNLALFGGTVVLIAWGVYRSSGQAWLAALLSGILAVSPVLLGIQVWAMSESLFLFLGFAGLLLLLRYLDTPRRANLIGAAALCGLAFLTRYMGASFIGAGGLALFLLGRGQDGRIRLLVRRAELREALVFGAVSLLPIIAWFIVDFSVTGTVGSRSGQPAAAFWQRFLEMGPALQNIYLFWLVPDSVAARLPGALRAAAWLIPSLLLIGTALLLARRARPIVSGETAVDAALVRMAALFGLFSVVYLVVLSVAQVFTYPPITLASRMLSPVHLSVLVFSVCLLFLAKQILFSASRLALVLVYLGMLGIFGMYFLRSVMIARDYHNMGIGYNSVAWRNSMTMEALRQIPPDVPLISNEVTAIMYLTGRPAYALQEIYQDAPVEPFTVYGTGEDDAQRIFREQNGALILFNANLHDDFAMYGDRIDVRLEVLTSGLYSYFKSEDGAIYFPNQPGFIQPGQ
jgi:4-amino-4-deoxy-L-arabinose transferase-like glycosyltransferase